MVAAFVLSAWMTVAVTSGVAHADSPPRSDGGSTSEGAPGPGQAGSPGTAGTPGASTFEASKQSGDLRDRLTRHLRPQNRIRATVGVETKTTRTTTPSRRASRPDVTDPGATSTGAVDDADGTTDAQDITPVDGNAVPATAPPTPASGPAAKPRLWVVPRALHSDRRLDLTAAVTPVTPVKPNLVAPWGSAVDDASSSRTAATRQAQPSVQSIGPRPSAANIAPAGPAAPSTAAAVGAVDVPQLGRQAVGLVSDIGVVAASVVYSVADTFAQAFGPDDFLGVPYALATALANTAAAAGRTLIGAPLDAAEPGRFTVTYGVLNGLSFFTPRKPPPGANDDSIDVTDEHPLPIILLNGTTATQGTNWGVGAPVLANAGYKVYTFNYGNVTGNPNSPIQATADIRKSAEELDKEVDRVLAETGAEKVILIGHSQGGGILPAYYINELGKGDKVSQVIGIAPSNHGTDFNGLTRVLGVPILGPLIVATVNVLGPAFVQQMVGSDLQQVVYGDQDTRPDILYTNIITRNDEIVTPYTQQALEGDNVTNIVLQERYPGYPAGHLGVVLSPQVWDIVLDALEANPEANPQLHPDSEELAA
jgi:triacylglycerol esterase/lipase EstA (alpha/beta hydrolase family)